MRYDNEHKARTRERVLKEAGIAIRRDGVDRIGVAAIMAAAGLTHGGFYAHFKSKDDLIDQAVDHMFAERYAAFFSDLESLDAKDSLVRFVDYYLSARHRDSRTRGCPIPAFLGQFEQLPDAARARFQRSVTRLTEGVHGLLERAAIDDPRRRANSAIAEMVGILMMSRLHPPEQADVMLTEGRKSVLRKLGFAPDDNAVAEPAVSLGS